MRLKVTITLRSVFVKLKMGPMMVFHSIPRTQTLPPYLLIMTVYPFSQVMALHFTSILLMQRTRFN